MPKLIVVLFVALALPGTALAAPPPNDNRDAAQVIETFPATLAGSTVEATVERLDPQLSQCGSLEGSVWYRIDQAPDGRVAISVQGPGLAPVLRVYRRQPSSIAELDCGSAAVSGRATASFGAVRGAGYLVLVGRRPGTAETAFELKAELFLPPANDSRRGAPALSLPGSIRGTTLGATSDELDPRGCELSGTTVWYRLRSPAGRRVVLQLAAAGDLDASFGVVEQRRSQVRPLLCSQTGGNGRGSLTYLPRAGAAYFLLVGHQGRSDPGTFTVSGVVAQPAERAAKALPAKGARSTVHYLTDVNDLWRVQLRAGVVYKIGFQGGDACPAAELRQGRRTLFRIGCGGVRTFTPGPDGGGTYVIEVYAGLVQGAQPYRLRIGSAGADDLGVGRSLPNGVVSKGALSTASLDVVDLWHFDIDRLSDVTLELRSPGLSLGLMSDDGSRLGSGDQLHRQLGPGRYVVAVSGANGGYGLSLLVREITRTVLRLPSSVVAPGQPVALRPEVTPSSSGYATIQIDRFDPLTGWHFQRLARVAVGSTLSWLPAAEGRWRVRARFLGTRSASPSRSDYAYLVVSGGV